MLGETDGGSGQIEALGGDAIDELLSRIKGNGAGNGGGGNGAGDGGGNGDGGGGDPMGRPIDGKTLLDALRRMAEFTSAFVLSATEKQAGFTMKTAETLTATGQAQLIELGRQLHETVVRAIDSNARLASAAAGRFEALESRIKMLERALGRSQPSADEGGGP